MMLEIVPDKTTRTLTAFIKESFKQAGFTKAVIALSGGVDSATSCALLVQALGPGNIFPVLLPYGKLNQTGTADAQSLIKLLRIPPENVTQTDIKPTADQVAAVDPSMDKVRRGNIMARVRMILLFDRAKQLKALVVGTENKSEHLLGYFTRFGDEASDIEPLRNLYKTQVYQLAEYLGVPQPILDKPPTAGLWQGQTDEGEFGFTYQEADEILFLHSEAKKTPEEIIGLGHNKAVVEQVMARTEDNDFKHFLPRVP